MMSRDEVIAAVKNHYRIRNEGSVEDIVGTLHRDCCHRIVGAEDLAPFTQVNSGEESLRKAADDLVGQWDLSGLNNVTICVEGETALIHRKGTVRHAGGVSFETEMIDKLTFRDGRIVEYDQFVDTYQIASKLGMIPARIV